MLLTESIHKNNNIRCKKPVINRHVLKRMQSCMFAV